MRRISKAAASIGLIMILCVSANPLSQVSAAEKGKNIYIASKNVNKPVSVNGIQFSVKQKKNDYTKYSLKVKKNGSTTIIDQSSSGDFITNGTTLFYATVGKKLGEEKTLNTIWRYDIKNRTKKKVISGINYTVRQCSGNYLYCGRDNIADGINLYAYNLRTAKKKHMADVVGSVACSKNRVITGTLSGDASNGPIYSFHLNGTGKKKIATGFFLKSNAKKIYYGRYSLSDHSGKVRIYTCDWNGKNKKPVTKWLSRIPDKYWN